MKHITKLIFVMGLLSAFASAHADNQSHLLLKQIGVVASPPAANTSANNEIEKCRSTTGVEYICGDKKAEKTRVKVVNNHYL